MPTAALSAPRARVSAPPARKPPSALTPRRLEVICEKIANGVPMTTAAITAGVPRRTFQVWLSKGREANAVEPYASMAERIEAALAAYQESRIQHLEAAAAAADPRVQADVARWELERRFKDDFGDPRRGDLNVSVQVVEAERSDLSARLLGAAQRVLGDDPELLARFMAEVAGGEVVVGEAAEVAELAPGSAA